MENKQMNYNNIINDIVNGKHDDMEVVDNDRELLYNRITLLNNLYNNMSIEDQKTYKNIISGYIQDIESELL